MQVIAIKDGFQANTRRRTGDMFDLDEASLPQKDGKPVLPKWVKVVTNPIVAKAEVAAAKKAEIDKRVNGAIAASGGKASQAKADSIAKQLVG